MNDAAYPAHIPVYDGVDWYWGRSLTGALKFIDQQRPDVVIFQWWTGAVLHTYALGSLRGAPRGACILEWHEGQDVGEATLLGARHYVGGLMPRSLSYVDAHVVHSAFDLDAITSAYSLGDAPVCVIRMVLMITWSSRQQRRLNRQISHFSSSPLLSSALSKASKI